MASCYTQQVGLHGTPDARRSIAAARSRKLMTVAKFSRLALSALLLAGCAVEVQNRQPVQEIAPLAKPHGSAYTGWRVFQDKCAGCLGSAATGAAGGPDLLPRVREMGSRRFVSVVLKRYDWSLAAVQAGSESAARSLDRRDRAAQGSRAHDAGVGRRAPRQRPYRGSLCLSLGTRRRDAGSGSSGAVARQGIARSVCPKTWRAICSPRARHLRARRPCREKSHTMRIEGTFASGSAWRMPASSGSSTTSSAPFTA